MKIIFDSGSLNTVEELTFHCYRFKDLNIACFIRFTNMQIFPTIL